MVVVMVVVVGVEVRIGKRTLPWWLFKQAAEDGAECVFQVQSICLLILRNESKKTKKIFEKVVGVLSVFDTY